MTRKEIEKRCFEEMQQNIPDREALWQRIEGSLGEQPAQPEVPHIRVRHTGRYIMTAAACLLVVVGASVFWRGGTAKLETNHAPMMDNAVAPAGDAPVYDDAAADEADEAAEADEEDNADQEISDGEAVSPQHSAGAPAMEAPAAAADDADADWEADCDADFSADEPAGEADVQDGAVSGRQSLEQYGPKADDPIPRRDLLYTQDAAFDPEEALARTELFVKAQVTGVSQDPQTGIVTYALSVLETYEKSDVPAPYELTLRTRSPYTMTEQSQYLLTLCQGEDGWQLVSDSTAPIGLYADGTMLVHSEWTLLEDYADTRIEDGTGEWWIISDPEALDVLFDAWTRIP